MTDRTKMLAITMQLENTQRKLVGVMSDLAMMRNALADAMQGCSVAGRIRTPNQEETA